MPDRRMSVAQLADLWGCSRQHVYNLVARNEVSVVRVGSLLRFRMEDVRAYEEARATAAKPSPVDPPPAAPRPRYEATYGSAGFLAGQAARRALERRAGKKI